MGDVTFNIHIATHDKQMTVTGTADMMAEDLCTIICRRLMIAPIAKILFGLRLHNKSIFLSPNKKLETYTNLDFRIRFLVPLMTRLKSLDAQTHNYFFHQVRNDVLDNKIPEIVYNKYKDQLLGLGVADMYRVMQEQNKSCDELEKDYKRYIPKEVMKKHSIFTRKPIHNTLELMTKSKYTAEFVIDRYLSQINTMAPNYLAEEYKVFIQNNEHTSDAIIHVMPFHVTEPGLRTYETIEGWKHLCTIDELCFITIRNDATVEISRKNGIPVYIHFVDLSEMLSFVSICDGYYRLMIKWTFNLCRDITSPSLQQLHSMKCHGPVGGEFSYFKLQEKRANKPGCFVIRQCAVEYDTYYIDACSKTSNKPETYKVEKVHSSYRIIHDKTSETFSSMAQLIASYGNSESKIFLQECLPPSEYDKSQLLLCEPTIHGVANRVDQDDLETTLAACRGPRCIHTKDLLVYKDNKAEGSEKVSMMYRALWQVAPDKSLTVAMKMLKHDKCEEYMKDFISRAGQWAFLQSTSIVRLFGVTLRSPVSMIMEYMPYGPLDEYLRENRKSLGSEDLVEAASSLATALWHLAENEIVHGYIRCRKIMVASHDRSNFSVKLSDPGMHSNFNEQEIHWIPVEYFNNLELVQMSSQADVWAAATTLWEIFSYGVSPARINPTLTKKSYSSGHRLYLPDKCPSEIFAVMQRCWLGDPHQRMRPQVMMRDINHLLYQVFNSRRSHAYTSILPKMAKAMNGCRIVTGSACSLLSTQTGESNLLSASDIERHSIRSTSSSFSGGHTTVDDFSSNDTDTIACDLSFFQLPNFDFPTPSNSMDNVDAMNYILELGADCNVVLQGRIGQGFYGEVYKGSLEYNDNSEPRLVAVKKLKTTAQISQLHDFEREIAIMKTLKHRNIVEILGFLDDPEIQLIMEYVKHGSLRSYLKIYKHKITTRQLIGYARDIATGMEYLNSMHIIHRDLAARNILVVSENHVKISDFGLAQSMDKGGYYILKTNRDLPLKWYAPESVADGKFSSLSDVWSYGVTLWEMFSLGEEPPAWGPNSSHDTVSRLPCPTECPAEVYSRLLLVCWEFNPINRPSFEQLIATCQDLLSQY